MRNFLPPESTVDSLKFKYRIFLAGSIEMGAAENWQEKFLADLSYPPSSFKIAVLNPRRKDWNATWEQTIENPNFYQQVNWELDNLERATHIIMYFSPGTQSPISLLELGLYAKSGKLIVVCPEGFWRKGNVDMICNKLGIQQEKSLFGARNYILKLK